MKSAAINLLKISVGLAVSLGLGWLAVRGLEWGQVKDSLDDASFGIVALSLNHAVADICGAGFLRGTLVIPQFVLDELRHIADSSDSLRRSKGRRGLEMLNRLTHEPDVDVQILDIDNNSNEVDGKLVGVARELHASIMTTDYNLNRVASIQGVKVLNVNALANSLRPVVLPGEGMVVKILQEGKEPGQGVGYLSDGTMIVVDAASQYIDEDVDVLVTRVLQTAAGCIIFAQPKRA